MVAAGLPSKHRWLPYAVVGVLVGAILLARLHLGLTWFSKGVAGWLWALLWEIVLGAAYRRHTTQPPSSHGMATVIFVALACAGLTYITTHYERDLARYTPQYTVHALETAEWRAGKWRDLPTYRLDMEGRQNQPLTVQWAGSLDTFAAVLIQHGWRHPPPLGSRALLQWLRPSPPLAELPMPDGGGAVLRLWRSDRIQQHPQTPLWVGTVTTLRAATPLPLVTIPLTGAEFTRPLRLLQDSLASLVWKEVRREGEADGVWDGRVLLIHAAAPPEQ